MYDQPRTFGPFCYCTAVCQVDFATPPPLVPYLLIFSHLHYYMKVPLNHHSGPDLLHAYWFTGMLACYSEPLMCTCLIFFIMVNSNKNSSGWIWMLA